MIRQLFRLRSKEGFQARSPERDADTDNEAVRSVASAIDQVLARAEAERAGLKNRIDNVLSVAAIVGGNDIDDYLTRTEDRSQMLRESDAEIRRGQNRLRAVELIQLLGAARHCVTTERSRRATRPTYSQLAMQAVSPRGLWLAKMAEPATSTPITRVSATILVAMFPPAPDSIGDLQISRFVRGGTATVRRQRGAQPEANFWSGSKARRIGQHHR
jgi:hypothetical protein